MSFVVIDNLAKAYDTVQAVRGFSLSIEKGSATALVGPDGAGKTTIMRAMCDLLRPDEGRIEIDGRDVAREFDSLKDSVGYMPQIFSLYPDLSVEENLVFYGGIYGVTGSNYKRRRDELYEFSNLAPFAKRRAGALSGGMKQKLALSCALIHEPELLILDEPTTGVDPLSRRQFWEILLQFKRQGVTILVSTPYMDEVARTDRACFMFSGRKLAEGTPAELARLFEGTVYVWDSPLDREPIDRLDRVDGLHVQRFGAGVHVYIDDGHSVGEFGDVLQENGIAADRLRQIEPSLEDSFIQRMSRSTEGTDEL